MDRPDRRFPSKRDSFLVVILWSATLVLVGGLLIVWSTPAPAALRLFMVLVSVGATALIHSTLHGTHYTFTGDTLDIRSGPFRWTLSLDEIQSVTPTDNPLSGPALSLDRLEIVATSRTLRISPEDKAAFLAELARRAPGLVLHGDQASRH
jgi:hypothetical protein